jgi:signal transduction histidine kinase
MNTPAPAAQALLMHALQHELRTPLSAVLGASHLLKADLSNLPSSLQRPLMRWMGMIEVGALQMLQLVDNLAAAESPQSARAEAERRSARCDIKRAVSDAVTLLSFEAWATGTRIQALVPEGPPVLVAGTETAWRQVALNLLSNALKYSPRGSHVALRLERPPSAGGHARLSIEDQGSGMTAEQLSRLFLPFDRLGRDLGDQPGRGLGLFITQQITQSMGASITVSSTAGRGTRVEVLAAPCAV